MMMMMMMMRMMCEKVLQFCELGQLLFTMYDKNWLKSIDESMLVMRRHTF